MAWVRRLARFSAWAMFSAAVAVMLLSAVSLVGLSWYAAKGGGAALRESALDVLYAAKAGRVTNSPSGWTVGRPNGSRVAVSGGTGWVSEEDHDWWSYRVHLLRGGPMPLGSPSVVLTAMVHVPLVRTAGVIAAIGGVVFWASKRRLRPGACPACAYDLAGNTSGVCPECGTKAEPMRDP